MTNIASRGATMGVDWELRIDSPLRSDRLARAQAELHKSDLAALNRAGLATTDGSEQVEAINAVSGDRCIPHPHVFSDPGAEIDAAGRVSSTAACG